jgi:Tfp pilus assembly protein PilO
MNKMRAEKKKQLLIVLVGSVAILAGIWFGLISAQKDRLRALGARRANLEKKNVQMQTTLKGAKRVQEELAEGGSRLAKLEAGMATGDLYSWAINTIKQFQIPYKVEIPQFSQITGPTDVNLLPNFPYQQATLTISGTANYHDFGRFVADFENEFPFTRLANLNLEPVSNATTDDSEKLIFKVDIITLVKPRNS